MNKWKEHGIAAHAVRCSLLCLYLRSASRLRQPLDFVVQPARTLKLGAQHLSRDLQPEGLGTQNLMRIGVTDEVPATSRFDSRPIGCRRRDSVLDAHSASAAPAPTSNEAASDAADGWGSRAWACMIGFALQSATEISGINGRLGPPLCAHQVPQQHRYASQEL